MSTKECKFCDQCGKQMTVYDSDGDPVHQGIRIAGNLDISYSIHVNCGSRSGPIFNVKDTDLCSKECLAVRFASLFKYVGEQLLYLNM
jgi:hypothetical protein